MELTAFTTGKSFETLLFSFLLSIFTTLIATLFAKKTNLLDMPSSEPHKQHDHPVPVSGGLSFFSVIVIISFFTRDYLGQQLIFVICSSTIIFIFGLIDDYHALKPFPKLIGQILAAVVLILLGVKSQVLSSLDLPFSLSPDVLSFLDILITIFWMVAITNAYNLIDSMDGLMIGLAAWTLGFFFFASLDVGQVSLGIFCAALLGAVLCLSFFNSSPAFLFMGDSGAQTIGFLIAAISIIYTPGERLQSNTWFLPIMLSGVPIFDTTLVIVSRFRRGVPIFSGGLDHSYHRLHQLGLSTVQSVTFLRLTAFGLNALAFFAISQTSTFANILFFSIVITGFLMIIVFESETFRKK